MNEKRSLIEELLPLVNHAERAIVNDNYLDGNAVNSCRCHFLAVHLERTVARNANDLFYRGCPPARQSPQGSRSPWCPNRPK